MNFRSMISLEGYCTISMRMFMHGSNVGDGVNCGCISHYSKDIQSDGKWQHNQQNTYTYDKIIVYPSLSDGLVVRVRVSWLSGVRQRIQFLPQLDPRNPIVTSRPLWWRMGLRAPGVMALVYYQNRSVSERVSQHCTKRRPSISRTNTHHRLFKGYFLLHYPLATPLCFSSNVLCRAVSGLSGINRGRCCSNSKSFPSRESR